MDKFEGLDGASPGFLSKSARNGAALDAVFPKALGRIYRKIYLVRMDNGRHIPLLRGNGCAIKAGIFGSNSAISPDISSRFANSR
jgi:hypothetical protein